MPKPRATWWTVEEMYTKTTLCPRCDGGGRVKDRKCKTCGGVGRIDKPKAKATP